MGLRDCFQKNFGTLTRLEFQSREGFYFIIVITFIIAQDMVNR